MTEDRTNTGRDEHSDSHQPAMSRRIFLAATAAGSAALLPGGLSSLFRAAAAVAGSNFQFVEKTIPELQAAMVAGQITARELVLGYLDRIQQLNPTLHAVIETNPSVSLSASGLAGTGGIDASVSAPTMIGATADVGHLDVGGLLHGLV